MAKGSSSSPPITAVVLTIAVVIAAAISYKSYQSKKPSRDDEEDKDKNDNVNVVKKSDDEPHTDDIPEERKDRSTSDATPLTSNVHKDEERFVSVDEVVVNSTSSNEKHINETKPTAPKQKKKKKKIRPKLTPTSPTTPTEDNDSTAEDDLGFGDIATSSNSPKLLKKTIKLRPTPQKKQGSSISKGTNVKAPPNVEEGANYNSLSSYWKTQDKEHKFVAPIDSSASLPTSSLSKRINTSSSASLVDDEKKNVVSSSDGEIDTKQAVEELKKKDDEGVKAVEEIIKDVNDEEVVPKSLDVTETKDNVDVIKTKDDVLGEKVESIDDESEKEVPSTATSSSSPAPALSKEVAVESTQLEASTPKEEEVTKETVVEDIVADNTAGEGNKEMVLSTDEEVKPFEQEAVKDVEENVIDTLNSTNEDVDQQLIIPSPTTSEDESSSSNQQLIIPSATTSENESSSDKDDVDEGGGGSSSNSSSQEFVKIYKSPSNNALTESEFLSRDITTTTTEGLDISGKEEDGTNEPDMPGKEEGGVTMQSGKAESIDTHDAQSTSPNKDDVSKKEKEDEAAADDTKEESVESSANSDMKKNNNRKRNKKKGKGKKRR